MDLASLGLVESPALRREVLHAVARSVQASLV
jgi:hypothetical protein